MNESNTIRCSWLNADPIYILYHDSEWGRPQYDSIKLFEMLCLEGQQAGLSWITILKKRDNYRKLFFNFEPAKVAEMSDTDVKILLSNSDIVRHKDFVWNFVDKKPIRNNWKSSNEVPTQTDVSIALSKALKKRGFKYVGSTICYAFMQACGLVNDHVLDCFCRSLC